MERLDFSQSSNVYVLLVVAGNRNLLFCTRRLNVLSHSKTILIQKWNFDMKEILTAGQYQTKNERDFEIMGAITNVPEMLE